MSTTFNLSPDSLTNTQSYLIHSFPTHVHPSTTSITKRIIDIILAIVGLALTALIAISVALVMTVYDSGPIFYSQTRCGLNGRPFRIWKFRSMVVGAEHLKHLVNNEAQGHIFKNKNDPRITRVGKFLRRTSLDEFPQFWNVLLGEMSIVGTRPPTPDEVMHYSSHHWKRLHVKPGMTGEWQAHGCASVKNFEQIVSMDLDYQRQWSIAYDLSLIRKTLLLLLNKKTGAC